MVNTSGVKVACSTSKTRRSYILDTNNILDINNGNNNNYNNNNCGAQERWQGKLMKNRWDDK